MHISEGAISFRARFQDIFEGVRLTLKEEISLRLTPPEISFTSLVSEKIPHYNFL